jgi:hypothetical protein
MHSLQKPVRAGVDLGHGQFFRARLLVLDSDQISKIVDQMDKETTDIRQEAIKLSWYMRGGISYEQALQLSSAERTFISNLIKENLETTKKTGLPFF